MALKKRKKVTKRSAGISRRAKAIKPKLPQQPIKQPHPHAYGVSALDSETYLRAIPRGPHQIFSYWEIGPEERERMDKALGATQAQGGEAIQPVLRLYAMYPVKKTTASAGLSTVKVGEIVVPPGVRSHYIRVPQSGLIYRVDLGVNTPSGRFITLCQSNTAATPLARIAQRGIAAGVPEHTGGRTSTMALINYSLHSGKTVGEAPADLPIAAFDMDESAARELPGEAASAPAGVPASSWSVQPPAP